VLSGILILLGFQLVGEILYRLGWLPLPGPVIGMVLLMVLLWWKPRALSKPLDATARHLLDWLGLLFVPAGVGVISNLDVLRSQWVPILVGLVGSTLVSLVATAYLMHKLPHPSPDVAGDNQP
jgi:holin-like protein